MSPSFENLPQFSKLERASTANTPALLSARGGLLAETGVHTTHVAMEGYERAGMSVDWCGRLWRSQPCPIQWRRMVLVDDHTWSVFLAAEFLALRRVMSQSQKLPPLRIQTTYPPCRTTSQTLFTGHTLLVELTHPSSFFHTFLGPPHPPNRTTFAITH